LLGALGLTDFVCGKMPRRKMFSRAWLVVLLISGLSAAQLLPFFDLLNHSHRQENYNGSQWPMPATGWLNFLVPLFHYQSLGNGYFMQSGQFWTTSYYVGVGALALAVWAAARVRLARVWTLAALIFFCLILALGDATPIYDWLCHHVKIIGLMRFPIKFVILPVFALPLLAAYGLAEKKSAWCRSWFLIWIVPVILIGGAIGIAHRFRTPNDDWEATSFNALARVFFLTVIVGGLFFLRRISKPGLRRLLQVLLLSLVWLDLYCQLPQPPAIRRAAYVPNLDHGFQAPKPGVSRASIPYDTFYALLFANSSDATQDFIGHRFTLFSNCNLLDDIPKCDGFFPLYLREYADLPTDSTPMLDFLGVSQILTGDTNTFRWMPRSTFMPLLTGGQKPLFDSKETILQMLSNTNFDPRTEVYLPLETSGSVIATNPATVKITTEKFFAQKIEATVEADAPAMLVAAQAYYHPWRAYVDGKRVPLLRANFAFQALEIPAGRHKVTLIYKDGAFEAGAIISGLALAICLALLLQRRMKHADASPALGGR
jgi:hypothetical protein